MHLNRVFPCASASERVCVCVCARACVRACVRASCVRMCVNACGVLSAALRARARTQGLLNIEQRLSALERAKAGAAQPQQHAAACTLHPPPARSRSSEDEALNLPPGVNQEICSMGSSSPRSARLSPFSSSFSITNDTSTSRFAPSGNAAVAKVLARRASVSSETLPRGVRTGRAERDVGGGGGWEATPSKSKPPNVDPDGADGWASLAQ